MKKLLLLSLICSALWTQAQMRQVTGLITSSMDGSAVAGANITLKGSSTGTVSDADGKFAINVTGEPAVLVISFIGFATQEITVPASNYIAVVLQSSAEELQEVIVSVGRGSQRTFTDTPLPVDNFTAKDLATTGQPTFDKALQYRVPSFNSVNTPVNDATSLFDPYEIRNLGPSRTLILINGKRKNLTSLIYTQTSPGRGETGADLTAIPTDAIKRVEILRDGASAQYGSDAIAGVMNVILKDKYEGGSVTINTGSTLNYGGGMVGVNMSNGTSLKNRGFINYYVSFLRQSSINRKDPIDSDADAGGLTNGSAFSTSQVKKFLAQYPDGFNKNGTPDNTSAKFLINTEIPLGENTTLYANAAYVFRKSKSYANYRQPYWRLDQGLLHKTDASQPDYTVDAASYDDGTPGFVPPVAADQAGGLYNGYIGYQPSFDGDLNDYNGTLGLRTKTPNGWNQDMSLTVGGNSMLFTVDNTVNRSLRKNSPISFKPGGFSFNHIVGNIDLSKNITKQLYVGLGMEARSENWQLIAGDTASYSGQGANSFFGYLPDNAIKANRLNVGAYFDLNYDVTDSWLVGGTFRTEKYTDFGIANVYKFVSRLKLGEKAILRASYSTGFRAPTLHQEYLSLSQASFSGGNIVITGLANNFSVAARALGVPKLKAETSDNVTVGLGFNPNRNLSVTIDYYYITINDRIVYGNEITDVSKNISNVSFFTNAAKTRTSGIDVVASYKGLALGENQLNLNLAGNYTIENMLVGGWQGLNAQYGLPLFNQTQESLMTSSRPKFKFILGADLTVSKFTFNLNNTLFGPNKFNNADLSADLNVEFKTKLLTDVNVGYNITPKANISITVQNILNVMPEYYFTARNANGEAILNDPVQVKTQVNNITFAGRYPIYTYDGSHFSQFGTTLMAQLNYKF